MTGTSLDIRLGKKTANKKLKRKDRTDRFFQRFQGVGRITNSFYLKNHWLGFPFETLLPINQIIVSKYVWLEEKK